MVVIFKVQYFNVPTLHLVLYKCFASISSTYHVVNTCVPIAIKTAIHLTVLPEADPGYSDISETGVFFRLEVVPSRHYKGHEEDQETKDGENEP